MDSGAVIGIAAVAIPASGMVSGAIWRLATKIERLSVTTEERQRVCEKTHKVIDDARAEQTEWIRNVEGRLNDHCENLNIHAGRTL